LLNAVKLLLPAPHIWHSMFSYEELLREMARRVADYLVEHARGDTVGLNGRKLMTILKRYGYRQPPPLYRRRLWEYIIEEMEQRGWVVVENTYITGKHRRVIYQVALL